MSKTTKKADSKVSDLKADKLAIEQELKNIYDAYNSKALKDTIKKNIANSMSRIADVMQMKPEGTNKSPQFKIDVLNAVKEKFKIDNEYFTIAYNYNDKNAKELSERGVKGSEYAAEKARNLREGKEEEEIKNEFFIIPHNNKNAKESSEKGEKARNLREGKEEEIKDLVNDIVDKVDKMVDYNSVDEKVVQKNINDIVNKSNKQDSKIQQLINEGVIKMVQETNKQETKQEEKIIKNIVREAIDESTITQPRREPVAPKGDTPILSESKMTDTIISNEPIIERALVSEEKQMKMDQEVPASFYGDKLFSERVKEGKTKLSDLENNFTNPIQYPDQLLKWINMIGGWEQYKYNRGKFGLIDDAKGDVQYMEKMKSSLIMVCGDDIGVQDQPVGNIIQAVKELMIMKNCYYIYKFKASLPPQYGLIVNANKLMTLADLVGKGPQADQNKTNLQKPVVKGKERIEFEEQKKDLIEQSIENRQGATPGPQREFVPKPDINQDTIHKSQVQRGNRGLLQINMDSFNKRTINQGSLQQAEAIARGIKIIRPKKQFGRY